MTRTTKWLLTIFLLFSSITGLFYLQKNKDFHAKDYLHSESFIEFQSQSFDDTTKIIYYGSEICGDSQTFINWFIPKNRTNTQLLNQMIYVDVTEQQQSKNTWDAFKETSNIDATPTLVLIIENKEISRIAWNSQVGFPKDAVQKWLDDALEQM